MERNWRGRSFGIGEIGGWHGWRSFAEARSGDDEPSGGYGGGCLYKLEPEAKTSAAGECETDCGIQQREAAQIHQQAFEGARG